MIANRGFGRFTGGSSFAAAIAYVRREGESFGPVSEWSRGVIGIESAADEMTAVASQSLVGDPVYHLIVSWSPGEAPAVPAAREALDYTLDRIGLAGAQYVAALHDDGDRGCIHLHAIVNRVDPVTGRVLATFDDFEKMREAMRALEVEQGWREVPERDRDRDGGVAPPYQAGFNRYASRKQFRESLRRDVRPGFQALLERAETTWRDVHEFLRDRGLEYERVTTAVTRGAERVVREIGARIVDVRARIPATVAALGVTHRQLVERLGAYVDEVRARMERAEQPVRDRARAAARAVAALESSAGWDGVHRIMREHQLVYDKLWRFGARVWDAESHVSVSDRVAPGLRLADLTKRFGPFIGSVESTTLEMGREAVRLVNDQATAQRLIADPAPVLRSLLAHSSTVSLGEIDRDLAARVMEPQQREEVRSSVLERMVGVSVQRSGVDELRFTTREVLDEEHACRNAAHALAARSLAVAVPRAWNPPARPIETAPAAREHQLRLEAQQREAYEYATKSSSRLKVITGVPGAGKSTIINEIAKAYEEAGYRVRLVAPTHAAVAILRGDNELPSRTVSKEVYEWARGRDLPTDRDVIIGDEFSMVGTENGRALLEGAQRAGSVIIALGDDKQFAPVARGDALSIMKDAVSERVDLQTTARQREPFMRGATEALRAGNVRAGLEAYHSRDFVHEAGTQSDARKGMVEKWRELQARGVDAGMTTYTNRERVAVNRLAREAWKEMGRLQSRDVTLNTLDGAVPYAAGDRVIVRANLKELGLANGSRADVVRVEDRSLVLRREDGVNVRLDTSVHPDVQHAYCVTEHREQGATRPAELQLFTPMVDQRSLVVGMTRHTTEYHGYYSREVFEGGFDDLVRMGERVQGSDLATLGLEIGDGHEAIAHFHGIELDAEVERQLLEAGYAAELATAEDLGLG